MSTQEVYFKHGFEYSSLSQKLFPQLFAQNIAFVFFVKHAHIQVLIKKESIKLE